MTTTISNGSTIITPVAVTGYEADRANGTLNHTIIGSAADAVTLRPAGLRSGTLTCVMGQSLDLANSLVSMLSAASSFTLADTTYSSLGMTFVGLQGGKLALQLETDSNSVWVVTFDYLEIGS